MAEKHNIIWLNGNTAEDFEKILKNTDSPKHIAALSLDDPAEHIDFEVTQKPGKRTDEIICRCTYTYEDGSQENAMAKFGSADDILTHGQAHFVNTVAKKLNQIMKYEGYETTVDTSDMLLWKEPEHNIRYESYDVQNRHKIHLATLTAQGNGYNAEFTIQEENFRDNKDRYVTYDMNITDEKGNENAYTGRIGLSEDVLQNSTDSFVEQVNNRLKEALSWEGINVIPTVPDKTKFKYFPNGESLRGQTVDVDIHLQKNENPEEPEKE